MVHPGGHIQGYTPPRRAYTGLYPTQGGILGYTPYHTQGGILGYIHPPYYTLGGTPWYIHPPYHGAHRYPWSEQCQEKRPWAQIYD